MKNIIYIKDAQGVHKAKRYLSSQKIIALDTETTGLDPLVDKIILLQLGNDQRQYVFDSYKLGDDINPILSLLLDKDITKVAHNAKFDYSMMRSFYGIDISNWVCTMINNKLLTRGKNYAKSDLDSCLNKYIGFIDMDKRQQSSFIGMEWGDEFTEDQIDYAGEDVEYLIELWYNMKELLKERGMEELSTLENETIRSCGELELNGIYINQDKWLDLRDDASERAKEAKKRLDSHFVDVLPLDIFGEPVINYNSPAQLKPALGKILQKKLDNTSKGYLKTFDHEAIDDLFDFRNARKRVSTYGHEFLRQNVHDKTNRIHADFFQIGAGTGRMASRNPNTHVGSYAGDGIAVYRMNCWKPSRAISSQAA